MKFRPLLHQLQQTLGEDVTEEVKVALVKVKNAMQDLKFAIKKAQSIKKGESTNKLFSSPCSIDEIELKK